MPKTTTKTRRPRAAAAPALPAEAPPSEPILLHLIDPSPFQPRSRRPSPDARQAFTELVESIRARGVIQAITVRPLGDRFQLIAGERRTLASREVGLSTIPAVVRECSDIEAAALTWEENHKRLDLDPWEESKHIRTMVDMLGGDLEAAANQLGLDKKRAARRLHLQNLSPAWRKAVEDPKHAVSTWSASCLEAVARLPTDAQEELFKAQHYFDPAPSVQQIENLTGRAVHALTAAPWKLTDPDLVPSAGPCSVCPHRTSVEPILFDDLRDPDTKAPRDHCLQPGCWRTKLDAHVRATDARLREQHPKVVRLAERHHDGRQVSDLTKGAVPTWQVEMVARKTPGALPAVYVDGNRAGQITFVKLRESAPRDAGEKPPEAKKPPTTKARLARLRQLRLKALTEILAERLPSAALAQEQMAAALPPLASLAAMVAALGTSGGAYFADDVLDGRRAAKVKARTKWDRFAAYGAAEYADALRCALYLRLEGEIRTSLAYTPHKNVDDLERDCQRIAEAFRIDFAALQAEARERKKAPKDLRDQDTPPEPGAGTEATHSRTERKAA